MFSSKRNIMSDMDSSASRNPDTTIISSNANFDGNLNACGIVRIDGVFSGGMNVDGTVIVGDNGFIKGNIKAERVTIAGKVEGNIFTEGTLELTASAKLYGDIEVKGISIADGAIFQGKCIMKQQNGATVNIEKTEDTSLVPVE